MRLYTAIFCLTALLPVAQPLADYVGSQQCQRCHRDEFRLWQGSDHAKAMQLATSQSVLADFNQHSLTVHGSRYRFYRRGQAFYVDIVEAQGNTLLLHVKNPGIKVITLPQRAAEVFRYEDRDRVVVCRQCSEFQLNAEGGGSYTFGIQYQPR